MSQDFGLHEDDESDLRIYFLTDRRLYELVYKWVNMRDELGRLQSRGQWKAQFTSPLTELSLRGREVMRMVENVNGSRAIVISLWSSRAEESTEGEVATRVEVSDGELPASLVFILPSQTSSEIQQKERGQQGQSISSPPGKVPQLSSHAVSVERGRGEQPYDVIEVNRVWGISNEPLTSLPYKQALAHARSLEGEDVLILRYYGEAMLPPGKKRDSLEWLNPLYVPWQESLGFLFRGLYFETTNIVEVQGEQGPEKVPAEVYLATAFQAERAGPRDVSVYRPFGRREDAIEWLNTIAHVKASLTRLVPDPGSTNWFVLSDMQNLNPLGFRQEGPVEWLS